MVKIDKKYKIKFFVILSIVICAYVVVNLMFKKNDNNNQISARILYVKWGMDKTALSYKQRGKDDGESIGPVSFFVTSPDDIYVLDNVNRRIAIYKKNQFIKELKLTTKYYPTDIYVSDEFIYFLTDLSLEKFALNGTLIQQNLGIRKNSALRLGAARLLVSGSKVIVSPMTSTKGEISACFDTESLNDVSCGGLDNLFSSYDVIDVDNGKFFVALDNNTLGVIENDSAQNISKKIKLGDFTSELMYPATTLYRVRHKRLYSMYQDEGGFSIYEQIFDPTKSN